MPEKAEPHCCLCVNESKMPPPEGDKAPWQILERDGLFRFQPAPLSQGPPTASTQDRAGGGSEPDMSFSSFTAELSSHQWTPSALINREEASLWAS